jgi:proline iminopeptidase
MDRVITDFEEVRNALGIDTWLTLGHSFGGILQMGYMERYPHVIKGMIMINCTLNLPESFNTSWFPKACAFLNNTDCNYYLDTMVPIKARLDSIVNQLVRKDIIWKMSFTTKEDNEEMNTIFYGRPPENRDFFSYAFEDDYLKNFLSETKSVKIPILFFYGERDWCIGPEHYKGIKFPEMILWKSDGEHMMPFLRNRPELEKAINSYLEKYKF